MTTSKRPQREENFGFTLGRLARWRLSLAGCNDVRQWLPWLACGVCIVVTAAAARAADPPASNEPDSGSAQELAPLVDPSKKAEATTRPAPRPAQRPASTEANISPAVLDSIKHATVFIRVKHGQDKASGSGFVISTSGGRIPIATNHHVVGWRPIEATEKGKSKPTPRSVAADLKKAEIEVVFDSGTGHERVAKAEALAADPTNDLSLLQVTGLKDPPAPIDFVHTPELYETMPIYTFGFPFGEVLAMSRGNPAITVGRASISSLRLDAKGKLAVVQIDGAINPGNSGGPLVSADGKLVGVAVATIKNSSGIGLAIPAGELPPMAQGQCGPAYLALIRQSNGQLMLRFERWVVDPLNKIQSISLHYRLAEASAANLDPQASLEKQPGCQKVTLTMDKHVAYADIPLGPDTAGKKLVTQTVVVNAAGPKATDVASFEIKAPPAPARIVVRMPRTRHGRVRVYITGGSPPASSPANAKEQAEKTGNETSILGGGNDGRFAESGPDGALLVGLDIGIGDDVKNDRVRAVRGVFRQGDRRFASPWHGTETGRYVRVEAKPGFAVGAMTVKMGHGVEGLCVTFMHVNGDKLDNRDSYESDWIGGYGGNDPQLLSGQGRPVVGLIGRENARECTGLGLALSSTDPPSVVPPPQRVAMSQSSKALPNRTVLVGNTGVARYQDIAPEGSMLVGIEFGVVPSSNKESIRSLSPIFREGEKEPELGEQHGTEFKRIVQVVAKPGYAVGAMSVRNSNADGVKLTFMRIKDGQLDPSDSYDSGIVGEQRPDGWTNLTGDGHPVVGIIGSAEERSNLGLGLLFSHAGNGWEELP